MPVTVINMIPQVMSGETQRDSEPSVSVNPANPLQIAASAFTPDPASSGNAPIFFSIDGGNTWALNVVLPGGNKTGDTSLRFGTTSNTLYAAILRSDTSLQLNILRSADFTAAGLMTTLVNRGPDDQPWVEAATAMGGAGRGDDHLYVSSNDITQRPTGRTATIEQSLDAATAAAPAGISVQAIEVRASASIGGGNSQDGPAVRTAIHPNGTIYGAYFGWRTFASPNVTDVVVVRDDDWGAGTTPYRDLTDPGDSLAGVRVVTGVQCAPLSTRLGTQRIGSQITIAVDPTNSQTCYLAWCDGATAANYSIHLRRSVDGGANWSADLRTITTATNPCLAVTSHGKVGFMYQQLGNPGTGNRWRTHLEVSDDAFASAATDFTLADVSDANGSYTGSNPIGDYANLIALGKDLYGVFSANNTPINANFPNGVTYQRNANFTTNTLLGTDNVTLVNVSIDPFFVRYTDVEAESDFYVRDWTDSATSGDTGLEPSTHSVFYRTSDVWNRRGTLPGAFVNDKPSNEDAGNGAGDIGDNWAFARIRRNAAPGGAGPDANVTAHFLVSKFGTGSNYVDAGTVDPDVSFPDPDPITAFGTSDLGPLVTIAYPWHLNAVTSTHLCLAVEISAPGDPFVPPSLVGRAPGWPTTDLAVINDNNKAQRNMGLSTTPARGAGLTDDFFGLVHNAATTWRDIEIRVDTDIKGLRHFEDAQILIAGTRSRSFKPGQTVILKDMSPGENRWVGLSFRPPKGKPGETFAVMFSEIVNGKVINGYGIGTQIRSDAEVARATLELHRSVFTRLATGHKITVAAELVKAVTLLMKKKRLTTNTYTDFLTNQLETINEAIEQLFGKQKKDSFAINKAFSQLVEVNKGQKFEEVAVAHMSLLNRLDSACTAIQLKRGDPADVLQNVRWMEELYNKVDGLTELKCAPQVLTSSRKYIHAFERREATTKHFTGLIEELLECFKETAGSHPKLRLEKRVEGMAKKLDDVAALQKAHRSFLLGLARLRR